METIQKLKIKDYIEKISKVEIMLEEIKRGLSYFDREFHKSIKRGEKDIEEGRVTVCKTKEDIENFFASI